jgi:hypothetical protein
MNRGVGQGESIDEEYDFSKEPPERSVSLVDSDYQLKANLPV